MMSTVVEKFNCPRLLHAILNAATVGQRGRQAEGGGGGGRS